MILDILTVLACIGTGIGALLAVVNKRYWWCLVFIIIYFANLSFLVAL